MIELQICFDPLLLCHPNRTAATLLYRPWPIRQHIGQCLVGHNPILQFPVYPQLALHQRAWPCIQVTRFVNEVMWFSFSGITFGKVRFTATVQLFKKIWSAFQVRKNMCRLPVHVIYIQALTGVSRNCHPHTIYGAQWQSTSYYNVQRFSENSTTHGPFWGT